MIEANVDNLKLADRQVSKLCSVRENPRLTRILACCEAVSQPITHATPNPRSQHDTTSPRDLPTTSDLRIFDRSHNS